MALTFNPANEIFFKKTSNQSMRGLIQIKNQSSKKILAFKIKCTNPQIFIVTPIKGTIKTGESITVEFITVESVSLDFAKQLVNNHKFLIEYVPITSQFTAPNFKDHETQRKKYYINMDSIRSGTSSRLFRENVSMNSGISNKQSYISMKNENQENRGPLKSENSGLTPRKSQKILPFNSNRQVGMIGGTSDDMQTKYSRLKQQYDELYRQRQNIVIKMSSVKKNNGFNVKAILVFIFFVIAGMFLGNIFQGFLDQRAANNKIQQERLKLQELQRESQNGWQLFGIFDWMYDELDAEEIVNS